MNSIVLIEDSHHGIYIPQLFANYEFESGWSGINGEDIIICKRGPNTDGYWEAWESILNSARFTKDGQTWCLCQDGDLWAVCYETLSHEEYIDFFGECKECGKSVCDGHDLDSNEELN